MKKVLRSIRYDPTLLTSYMQISKLSGIPKDALVHHAMTSYLNVLEKNWPDYKFIEINDVSNKNG
jgi:hypothetical protein